MYSMYALLVLTNCVFLIVVLVNGIHAEEMSRVKRNLFGGEKPEGALCTINPCNSTTMTYCYNSGTCYLDDVTCMYGCHCTKDYTGPRCEQLIGTTTPPLPTKSADDIPTTTLRPISERECMSGFVCVHGYCDTSGGGFSCSCDTGWNGVFCDVCPIQCPNDWECMFNGTFYCWNDNVLPTTTEILYPTIDQNDIPTTTLRPISERECISGFVCVHGYCDTSGGGFSCSCDTGWNGVFCDVCPIQCPNDWECMFNGTFYCWNDNVLPTTTEILYPTIDQNDIPTTTLRPISERECIPGFECIYGYCDRSQGFRCDCDFGWKGGFCEILDCPLQCPNDTECILVNAAFYCWKDTTVPSTTALTYPTIDPNDIPTTTLRPMSARECIPGFECIHGYCDRSQGFGCDCDFGWTGGFCERLDCPLQCPSDMYCGLVDETFYCVQQEMRSEASPTTLPITTTTVFSAKEYPADHACSANYTQKPISERECLPNFACTYGICQQDTLDGVPLLECICDDGAIGGLCQEQCCLQCAEHGKCKKFSNDTEYCHCQFNYDGSFCEKKKVAPDYSSRVEQNWWPLWVSAIILVCLILAAGLLFFWMWRNRVTIVMKIVHYFQAYEDDDEKTWDAFVSYKSADVDQNFVLRTLFPKLEKELGFTLCLHFRDFMPGETIANNIINAVNNSRRTILILTPRYVQSEFTRFEYQVAQHEMLKRKHRIIPILLEDISESTDIMDPNLKQIIKSVTYLEYPGQDATEKKINHFWKKLTLSMPKKRSIEEKRKQVKETVGDITGVTVLTPDHHDKWDKNQNEKGNTAGESGHLNPTFIDLDDISVKVLNGKQIPEKEEEVDENIEEHMSVISCTHL